MKFHTGGKSPRALIFNIKSRFGEIPKPTVKVWMIKDFNYNNIKIELKYSFINLLKLFYHIFSIAL